MFFEEVRVKAKGLVSKKVQKIVIASPPQADEAIPPHKYQWG